MWAVRAEAWVYFQLSKGETLTIQAELWSFLAAESAEDDEAELKLAAVFAQLRGIANRVFHPVARTPTGEALAASGAVAQDSGDARGAAQTEAAAPEPGLAATSSAAAINASAAGTATASGGAILFGAEGASAHRVENIETMNPLQAARVRAEQEESDELSSEDILYL